MTPLLSQWTYQAMVHELIGVVNGRVRIEDETRPELKVRCLALSRLVLPTDLTFLHLP